MYSFGEELTALQTSFTIPPFQLTGVARKKLSSSKSNTTFSKFNGGRLHRTNGTNGLHLGSEASSTSSFRLRKAEEYSGTTAKEIKRIAIIWFTTET